MEKCPKCGYYGLTKIIPWQDKDPRTLPFCDCAEGKRVEKRAWEMWMRAHPNPWPLPERYKAVTFDSLEERGFFPEGVRAGRDLVARGTIVAEEYQEHEEAGKEVYRFQGKRQGLLIVGPPEVGKTLLAAAVANGWGCLARWVPWRELVRRVQAEYGKPDGRSSEVIDEVCRCDYLVLDDLGTSVPGMELSLNKKDILYQIIFHRHAHMLPVVITTAVTSKMYQVFTEPIANRMVELCCYLKIGS